MFWKRTNLYKRVEKLFKNMQYICEAKNLDKSIKVLISDLDHCGFEFKSRLGKVGFYVFDESWDIAGKYKLSYYGVNDKHFSIEVDKDTTKVEPAITKSSIMKAEEISLAIYELEKYIEENNLDRDTLENFHISEVKKLENY